MMEGAIMEPTSTRALLVEPPDLAAESAAISATIPRSEIEAALSSDLPLELYLDVKRLSDESSAEERTLSVAWERADLERLLDDAQGDAITFSFAHDDLERAFEDDVEAHGLRERMLVLTVAAAAAAGASASVAASAPDPGTGGSTPPAAQVSHGEAQTASQLAAPANDEASLAARGIQAGSVHDEATLASRGIGEPQSTPAHDEASLAARGIQSSPTHDEATLVSRGIETPTVVVTHDEALTASQLAAPANDEASLAARGIQAVPAHDEATLASRGIEAPPAVHDEATLVDRGIEAPPVAVHDEATLAARGIEPTPVGGGGDTGFDMPTFDATTAAVTAGIGGAALLITAAGFAARRGRGPRPV
jgi:hypothetical protein